MMKKKRILFVDDTAYFKKLLSTMFEKAGYEVEGVENGKKCYELVSKNPGRYDLLMVDVLLPDMLGIEVIEKLRSETRTRDLPIAALTGVIRDAEELKKLRRIGASMYIHRSMPPEEILFKVNSMLQYPTDERRAAQRIAVNGTVEYFHEGAKFYGYLFTMSLTGVFIRTIYPLPLRSHIRMRIPLLGEEKPLECDGVITRIVGQNAERQGETDDSDVIDVPGMGVMFQNLDGETVRVIEGFIQSKRE